MCELETLTYWARRSRWFSQHLSSKSDPGRNCHRAMQFASLMSQIENVDTACRSQNNRSTLTIPQLLMRKFSAMLYLVDVKSYWYPAPQEWKFLENDVLELLWSTNRVWNVRWREVQSSHKRSSAYSRFSTGQGTSKVSSVAPSLPFRIGVWRK